MNGNTGVRQNIVLIGFMGSGKTTVGRELHQRLGYPLVDMDHIIEQRQGRSVSDIFTYDGEPAFREMETSLLRELLVSPLPRQIISTGGGVVVRPENMQVLRRLGYVVWLHASPAVILERTAKSRTRPLLQGENPAAQVATLLFSREELYRKAAHLKVDSEGFDCAELATGILESARYFFTPGNDSSPAAFR